MSPRHRTVLAAGLLLGAGLPAASLVGQAAHAAASCAAPAPGGDWPTLGHDPANTRAQPAEDVIGPDQARTLTPAWSFHTAADGGSGGITGTPVEADGCVFVGDGGGNVFALNADTGERVWHTHVPGGGGINATLAVDGGRVYGLTSLIGAPGAFALGEADGRLLWTQTLDTQPGADAYASPVVFKGNVFAGWSGESAETATDEGTRYAFQGGYDILAASDGKVVVKNYTIHPPGQPDDDRAGGTIWSTGAVDTATGMLYVGTGNPFNPHDEAPTANSIIKVDMNPTSPTFGQIVDHYHGTVDTYEQANQAPCVDFPGNPPPWYPQGLGSCADIDLDFGASPNLFTVGGRTVVGDGQKSGVYHAVDTAHMATPMWTATLGAPSLFGGIVGSAAWDAKDNALIGPVTQGGYLWSVDAATGSPKWVSPTADGAHYGDQTTYANGVVYTPDTAGFLDAFDASTGALLSHLPVDTTRPEPSLGAGAGVARHTVYAPAGGTVTAFRPADLSSVAPVPVPTTPTTAGSGGGGSGGSGGAAPVDPVIVSGPGAWLSTFATPAVVVPQGSGATYLNVDAIAHDVQADGRYGPDTNPWCSAQGFLPGRCPLFWSAITPLGEATTVLGVSALPPGAYPFFCSVHPGMKGTLIVE